MLGVIENPTGYGTGALCVRPVIKSSGNILGDVSASTCGAPGSTTTSFTAAVQEWSTILVHGFALFGDHVMWGTNEFATPTVSCSVRQGASVRMDSGTFDPWNDYVWNTPGEAINNGFMVWVPAVSGKNFMIVSNNANKYNTGATHWLGNSTNNGRYINAGTAASVRFAVTMTDAAGAVKDGYIDCPEFCAVYTRFPQGLVQPGQELISQADKACEAWLLGLHDTLSGGIASYKTITSL